jgi:hypothetical protein
MKTMRYLLMALVLALILPLISQAVVAVSDIDSSNTSLTILLNFADLAAPDSGVLKWHLIFGSTNPPQTRVDSSAVGINGTRDTSVVNVAKYAAIYNGTKYYYYAVYWAQDTTTAARVVHYYSTATDSGITKTIGQTIAAITDSTSWKNFMVKDTYFGADSAFKKIAMQYRVKGTSDWTWATARAAWEDAVGRDSSSLASVDSLWALSNNTKFNLLANTVYEVRLVAWDSTGSDTSNTVEITTSGDGRWSYMESQPSGMVRPNVYHWGTVFTESNQELIGPEVPITGYKTVEFFAHLAGLDNNQTFDSVTVYIQTNRFNTWVSIDTLITRDIDTATAILWRKIGAITNGDSVEMKAVDFGDMIRAKAIVTDSSAATGDTMDIDPRYLNIIGIFKP